MSTKLNRRDSTQSFIFDFDEFENMHGSASNERINITEKPAKQVGAENMYLSDFDTPRVQGANCDYGDLRVASTIAVPTDAEEIIDSQAIEDLIQSTYKSPSSKLMACDKQEVALSQEESRNEQNTVEEDTIDEATNMHLEYGFDMRELLDITEDVDAKTCTEIEVANSRYSEEFLTDRGARATTAESISSSESNIEQPLVQFRQRTSIHDISVVAMESNHDLPIAKTSRGCTKAKTTKTLVDLGTQTVIAKNHATTQYQHSSSENAEVIQKRYKKLYGKFVHNLECIRGYQARDTSHKEEIAYLRKQVSNLEERLASITTELIGKHVYAQIIADNCSKLR